MACALNALCGIKVHLPANIALKWFAISLLCVGCVYVDALTVASRVACSSPSRGSDGYVYSHGG
jgi:hypothetical protein